MADEIEKSISDLFTAERTSADDLFETAIPSSTESGYLSRKISASELANLLNKVIQYAELNNKSIIDAILSGGGTIDETARKGVENLSNYNFVDLIPYADKVGTRYVNGSDELAYSTKWVSYQFNIKDGFVLKYLKLISNTINWGAINFYSDTNIANANFISNVKFEAKDTFCEFNNIDIPTGTQAILICSRVDSSPDHILIGSPYGNITDEVKKLPTDVQIGGTSIVEDGVANIPYATINGAGVVRGNLGYGINLSANGTIIGVTKSLNDYTSSNNNQIISKGTLENVKTDLTKRALTDNTQTEWSTEEKASARARLGASSELELIETIEVTENSSSFIRDVEPDGTPYNFKRMYILISFKIGSPIAGEYLAIDYFYGYTVKTAYGAPLVADNRVIINEVDGITIKMMEAISYPYIYMALDGNITKIKIRSNGNSLAFGVGTIIKIYGERA